MITPEELEKTSWYTVDADGALRRLDSTREDGLSDAEAEKRLRQFGPNELKQEKPMSPLMRFLLQFHQPLVYILIAAAAAAWFLGETIDAAVIFGVVLVNSIVGYVQEARAVKTLDALQKSVTTEVDVIRGGSRKRIPSRELVPGDIVRLRSGNKVPADLRLVHIRDLQVDESALTGESVAVEKALDALEEGTDLGDRKCQAYSGSLVTYGQALGLVVATGDRTEVGKISEMISSADDLETPLTRKITHFSHILLWAILLLAAITFGIGMLRGQELVENFMAAVALAVAAIPEGLPAVVTITLAIGVARMAKRRAIIRKLPAVETLGSTAVICTDKTGTLTENQMTVQAIHTGGETFEVSGGGYNPEGTIQRDGEQVHGDGLPPALREVLAAGYLCNDTQIIEKDGVWQVDGNPTEGALIASAIKGGLDMEQLKEQFPRLDSLPFESQHKYMATLHEAPGGDGRVVYVKGALEVLLDKCNGMLDADGNVKELDSEAITNTVEEMAGKGQRVLALARMEFAKEQEQVRHDDLKGDIVLLGIQAMIDPPRKAAIEAVNKCQGAGITIKMITGDHAKTALAIARQMGFKGLEDASESGLVYTGRELEEVSDEDLVEVVRKASVFARVTPEHKLRLVRAIQKAGNVVAMTGDGVNDAPALRQADIGVAMGITGTEVAKDASDMVLTDDNFESIEAAVEEGRGVFDNLTKFITYILPTNLGQALVILAAMVAGTTLPVYPVQALWINMTTAIFLGLTLAFEPKEPGIMKRTPREPDEPILTRALSLRMILVALVMLVGAFGLFEYEMRVRGVELAEARTSAVNVIIVIQTFYLFNCRSLTMSILTVGLFSNKWVWVGAGAMIGSQLLFTYTPFMNDAFRTAPTSLFSWAVVVAVGAVAFVLIAGEKAIRARM